MDLRARARDDRPFGGPAPPTAVFYHSPNRAGEHPNKRLAGYAGVLQADAYAGFNDLYAPARKPGPITEAGRWAHGGRKPFDLAQLARAPLAVEAVRRIDAVFDVERATNGPPAERRSAVRRKHVAPLVTGLEAWMRAAWDKMSRHADAAKAMNYMLRRWDTFARSLDDGRIDSTNNAAGRTLRGVALGRKAWLFAGSDRGGQRAAAMYSLITTAKLNGVDPRAWPADVLARINDHPAPEIYEPPPMWLVGRPRPYLAAFILCLVVSGIYTINGSAFDLGLVLAVGLVGYGMRRSGFPYLPAVLGVVLGPLVESNYRRSLLLSGGEHGIFLEDPIAIGLLGAACSAASVSCTSKPMTLRLYRSRIRNR